MLGLWGATVSFASGIITVMKKEYEKLTTEQFQELIGDLSPVFKMMRGMNDHLASVPAAKFDSVMTGDYGLYSHFYELPFIQYLSVVIFALNRQDEVKEMAASPDPQESVLAMLRKRDDVEDQSHNDAFDKAEVVALAYSLGRTLQSMVTYGRSISSLLQDVRENNNQDSLFKAIRMDRSVVGCPTAMKHIAKAQIRGSKAFFGHLRNALKGPQQKPMVALEPLRYALLLLREMGVNDLSQKQLESLFVDRLKVYTNAPGAGKNLMAQYQFSKKIPTI